MQHHTKEKNMKLQISFDMPDLDKAVLIAQQVAPYCDILEIGTLLIYKYGIHAIEIFKQQCPKKTILTDTKIVDRGRIAATLFCSTKTDWFTVMAGTGKDVIHTACTTAHEQNKKVMIDLMDSSSPGQSALDAQSLGANALLFHQPYDEQKSLVFLDQWDMVRGNTQLPIFVSAHINRENIDKIISIAPDGIIIGRAIVQAENPAQEAQFFYELISKQ